MHFFLQNMKYNLFENVGTPFYELGLVKRSFKNWIIWIMGHFKFNSISKSYLKKINDWRNFFSDWNTSNLLVKQICIFQLALILCETFFFISWEKKQNNFQTKQELTSFQRVFLKGFITFFFSRNFNPKIATQCRSSIPRPSSLSWTPLHNR